MKTAKFNEKIGRSWLIAEYDGKVREYAYPLVQGTHQDCYTAINSDAELVPTKGLNLALLANGAFSRKTAQWQDVKETCFRQNYVRVPVRLLWIPQKDENEKENELAGILIEEDLEGKGLSTKMSVPDVSEWKNENGIYVNVDRSKILVPEGAYLLGQINETDGFLRGVLTGEGAEMYVKTAIDNKRKAWSWGLDTKEIKTPQQRMPVLRGYCFDGLVLDGNDFSDYGDGFASGVKKSAEGTS